MAWIEQRHRKYVPYARIEGRKVPGPASAPARRPRCSCGWPSSPAGRGRARTST
jgi:hypothetical protein